MYREHKLCIVVPAYNEEKLISRVLDTMPQYVDMIIVVNDSSTDDTLAMVKKYKSSLRERLMIIHHKKNKGVGGAIVSGYKAAIKEKMDLIGVMAGDAQMDPLDLPKLCDVVIDEDIDYAKGNRLLQKDVRKVMPKHRYFGNSILTILNKIATGYWKIMDPQDGYTVTTRKVLENIPLDEIYPRYGVPNDILAILNVYNFKVKDVSSIPIYGDEVSGIKLYSYIPKVSFLLFKRFFWRLKEKYLLRDFHPLALFYLLGLILLTTGFLYSIYLLIYRILGLEISINAVLLCVFLLVMGFQFLFFGMLFDMEYNRELNR